MSHNTAKSPDLVQDNTNVAVYLALGSNMGNRYTNLTTALESLREFVRLDQVSSIYETEPVGYLDQPYFFNIVCVGKTALTPQELLSFAKTIETSLGRKPSFRNAPRPIDIDILIYDDLSIQQDNLIIPHPRMKERAFVLAPLLEISPDIVDPTTQKPLQEMLVTVSQAGIKKLTTIPWHSLYQP